MRPADAASGGPHPDSGRPDAGPVRVRVPAKVNLSLSVGDVRPDGFHELVTVFHAVGLWDEVVVTPAARLTIAVSGRDADAVPVDERNLAWRAAVALAGETGRAPDVRIDIAKDIPVAGGMAGGSADAAATLAACARLWGVRDRDLLFSVAGRLGSDVAFPLLGGTAVGTGRGELLRPVPCATALHWVFAFADFGIAAGDAYRELDRQRSERPAGASTADTADTAALVAALAAGDAAAVAARLHNDLQPAALALAPSLHATLNAGAAREGVLAGVVSGSGPTCAFLCRDAAAAAGLAAALEAGGVCRAARIASGPVEGAAAGADSVPDGPDADVAVTP